jgi:cleavage stimulation factor subunit 1
MGKLGDNSLLIRLQKNRLQITFSYNEDFIISSDENAYAAVVWETRTGEMVQRLSGHTNVIPWVASSPVEGALMTCRFGSKNYVLK